VVSTFLIVIISTNYNNSLFFNFLKELSTSFLMDIFLKSLHLIVILNKFQ
jgi:hypothetical protein